MSNNSNKTLHVGTVIQDKWVILEFIGKGGMGEVYRAHQVNLKRDIALKIISREWLGSLEDNEEEIEIGLQRFRNEVLSMAQVRHPNILQIHDYGSFSVKKGEEALTMEYIAMEYIPGGTLRSTMSEEGFYPEEDLVTDWVKKYFSPVLDGVQALHSAGIIHRDLKPGNILMDGNTPKISDFGLARSTRIRPVTTSMDMKGTPPYMSPEHFMDLKRVDNRADVYSLGKILYEAVEGKMGPDTIPFKSASLKKAETPFFERLDLIIRMATAEDKNARFRGVEDFGAAILGAIKGEESDDLSHRKSAGRRKLEVLSRPQWIWGGIAISVILVLAMTFWHHFLGGPGKPALEPNGLATPPYEAKPLKPPFSPQATAPVPGAPQSVITGGDGARLHIVPEGQFLLENSAGQETGESVNLSSFYMDETEVTNHQYVEFLNKVLSRIRVEGEKVEVGGRLWFVLGEVAKGYEPIVFRDGKFVVIDPLYHSHPVVRVTAFGAAAYAEYYGRRLPSVAEWLYAMRSGNGNKRTPSESSAPQPLWDHMETMHPQGQNPSSAQQSPSKMPVSVTNFPSDKHGIRGLQGNVSEWGISTPIGSTQTPKGNPYVVLPESVSRGPWEAFEDVGFRTVLSVLNPN